MKIKLYDESHQLCKNTSIQLQVKGKNSGTLSLTTNDSGEFQLDDKYNGQQIAATSDPSTAKWVTASEGGSLTTTEGEATTSYKY